MKRFYRNHLWVSKPDSKGLSYLGLSPFIKDYFIRLKKIDYEEFFKIKYGLKYNFKNELFLERIGKKMRDEMMASEKIEYDRFAIQQDEPFCKLLTAEFDVQLAAPIEMRIIDENFQGYYN